MPRKRAGKELPERRSQEEAPAVNQSPAEANKGKFYSAAGCEGGVQTECEAGQCRVRAALQGIRMFRERKRWGGRRLGDFKEGIFEHPSD